MASEKTAQEEAKRIETAKKKEEEKKSLVEKAKEIVKPTKKAKKEDDKVLEEKIVTIGLQEITKSRRMKRTNRAIHLLKRKLERITKKPVKISKELNSVMWVRGLQHPPRKIKVKAIIKKDKAEIVPA